MNQSQSQRLYHFDVLKGIAILLVVVGHVVSMCIRGIDRAFLLKFVGETHMPIFFFISGWLGMKYLNGAGGKWRTPALTPRFKRLLIPMVAVSALWALYIPHTTIQSPFEPSLSALWCDQWKYGYWFTFVLLQHFIILALVVPVFNRMVTALPKILTAFAVWALLIWGGWALPENIVSIMSLQLTATYFPVFMAGVFAKAWQETFGRRCLGNAGVSIALVLAVPLFYYISWPWEFGPEGMTQTLLVVASKGLFHILVATVAIAALQPWCQKQWANGSPGPAARMWSTLGRESLGIYLLHYFFLFNMAPARQWLEGFDLAFVPTLAVALAVAAIIVAAVMALIFILKPSRWLSFVLTGAK